MKKSIEKGRKTVLARSMALALMFPLAVPALAQDAPPATDEAEDTTELDAVVVTGSRIPRAEIEGPAPVVVITAEDLAAEGFTTVYEALNTVTQFTGSVQNEFNQNGFTPNANFINLRGLGPGYQLILINGRRASDYPLPYNSQSNAVNLGNIPAAAIERIEILTGGASAIYGSDAVAGVVNIILRKNFEGNDFTARWGTTTRGGGETFQFQWVGGKAGDRWSLTYAFEAIERAQLFASEREFMDSYYDDPSAEDIDINPVEGLLAFDGFNSDRLTPIGTSVEEVCGRFSEFETYIFETSAAYTGPRCGYPGYPATQVIRNADSNQSAFVTGTFDFNDSLQGFAELFFTNADAKIASSTQFWQNPGSYIFDPNLESDALGPGGGALVQLQRIITPAEIGGNNVQATRINEKSYDLAVGLRGTMFSDRFDWDLTLSRSEYKIDSRQPRFLENEVNDFFLGEQLGFDPYFDFYPVYELNHERYFNPISPADFATLNTIVHDVAESSVNQANFTFSGDLFEMPAGPVSMAGVLEFADQEYSLSPDERTRAGYDGPEPIYNLVSTIGGGDRQRSAAGVEFAIPVLETLRANVAGRYDHFSDASSIDGASTWQVGLEWRPLETLLFRASHGTSFRAPDMHYIYAAESQFFTSIFDEYRCRADGFDPGDDNACSGADYNYQVAGRRRGDAGLDAERGKSTTVGFVWDVTPEMTFSLDYYDIELRDAVGDIGGFLFRNEADCLLGEDRDGNPVDPTSTTCQFYLDLVERGSGGPLGNEGDVLEYTSFPINQSLNTTTGVDATFTYDMDTDRWGDFSFALAWTHVLSLEFQEFEGEPTINVRDHMQYFNFRSRINGSIGWAKDDWNVNVYGTRWGSLPNWAETDRIGPHMQYNLNVSKKFTPNLTVGLFVNNVLDDIHPKDDTFNTWPYFWRAFSPVGREVFLQVNYKFN